ncbi:MAG TPA: carboxypeptidase-like regulatory domain-containing protein [Candidatus Thermoplasmatota archaeon]
MAGKSLLVLVVVTVALAGCAKGAAEGTTAEGPVSVISGGAEPIHDAGLIKGVVTDDSVVPLAGAVVGLVEVEGIATTGESGEFSFENLAPGVYTLNAARLGFASVASRVEVVAGQETNVHLVLRTIAIVESYLESIEFRMFMACGGGLVGVTFTGGCPAALFPTHDVTADHNVTGPAIALRSLVAELIWQQTSALSSKELRLTGGINESSGSLPSFEERYYNVQGPSPVYAREDADEEDPFDGLDETNERYYIRHRVWVPFSSADPPIVILVFEQPMTIWSTLFYGEEAPENFSALPDA